MTEARALAHLGRNLLAPKMERSAAIAVSFFNPAIPILDFFPTLSGNAAWARHLSITGRGFWACGIGNMQSHCSSLSKAKSLETDGENKSDPTIQPFSSKIWQIN